MIQTLENDGRNTQRLTDKAAEDIMVQTAAKRDHDTLVAVDKVAEDIMILARNYPFVSRDATIKEAISRLMLSYDGYISNKRLIYTVHRSILVTDETGRFVGVLSVRNLIQALTPDPEVAIGTDHEFWTRTKKLADTKVEDVMQHSLVRVRNNANLTQVAREMARYNTRRVVVVNENNDLLGIVREQELFFEMANIVL